MKPHKGQTNKAAKIKLKSAISFARWTKSTASPGGTVGLEVVTSFVGNGSDLQIELSDANGKKYGSFKEQITGNRFWAQIKVPPKAEKALVATVKLPKHGLESTSPALFLTPPVVIKNAKWDKDQVRRGDVIMLSADVEGAVDGTKADVSIWEHDVDGAHELVVKFPVLVEGNRVKCNWEFEYVDDTDVIPTADESDGRYAHPEYFFRVTVGGVSAESNRIQFLDSLQLHVKDLAGRPIKRKNYVLHLADGRRLNGTLDDDGYARAEDIAPGRVRLEFKDF